MAGLVPATHVFVLRKQASMPGNKAGHDAGEPGVCLRRLRQFAVEGQTQLVTRDNDLFAIFDRAREDHLRERVLNRFLDTRLSGRAP